MIKSVIITGDKPREEFVYPSMGTLNNRTYTMLVLFEEEGSGTVLYDGDTVYPHNVGMHSSSWPMDSFTPYYGTVQVMDTK
jgi:hypothetical protein